MMSEFQAHKDAPDEVWLQIGYGDEGEHTWAPHEIAEDGIEEAGPYVRADRLSGRVTAEGLVDYFREHEARLEQVQGFSYGLPGTRLTIRDCWLDPANQVVWEKGTSPDRFDADHAEMMRQIEIYRFSLALAAIDTAPAPSPDQIRREADDLCVVWSNEHRAWWRANSAGYAKDVSGAGVYSRDEAMSISHGVRGGWFYGRRPDEIPVRVADLPQWAREALITGGDDDAA